MRMPLAIGVTVMLTASVAAAQSHVAIEPVEPVEPVEPIEPTPMVVASPDEPAPRHSPGAIVAVAGLGVADTTGIERGGLFRMDITAFPIFAPRGRAGPMLGVGYGVEVWRSDSGWGFGVPAGVQLGVKLGHARATLGGGVHAFLLDRVNNDTGVGAYSPYAMASAGIDFGGFTILGDARVTRRWLYDAPDRTQWTFSVLAGWTGAITPRPRRPATAAIAR